MIIKVCGMSDGGNIWDIEEAGADMIGFIFYTRSPRYVVDIPDYLPVKAKRTGVFVNAEQQAIKDIAKRFELNYIQLHGSESPQYCRDLAKEGLSIIKAFPIGSHNDLTAVSEYDNICSYFLFDTKCEDHGGSGEKFDWHILHSYNGNTEFLLSGGIDLDDVGQLCKFNHPRLAGYDINSRFETDPGLKDASRVKKFIEQIKNNINKE